MQLTEILGFFGVVLLAISWIPQTLTVLKEKKSHMNLKFILIYSGGSLLLLVYSVLIVDIVYIILNSITTVLAAINLFFALRR